MARQCFYTFQFMPGNCRAATVRSIGVIEGNEPALDNEWEAITSGPDKDEKIQSWIARQMKGKTCNIVLVGAETANRKWINHEIVKAWNDGLGVVAIRVHRLTRSAGLISSQGANPFHFMTH